MGKEVLKTKSFDLPVYGSKVIFIYSNSWDLVRDFLVEDDVIEATIKDMVLDKPQGLNFHACHETTKVGYYYVVVMKDKDKYNEIDTITHEIFHLVNSILQNRDIKYNKKNEEPYAYLIGHLNKEFFKFKDTK